ncbi:MAG: acyclic terpene utilization AtuA family protein [Oligoflexus sp.]
MSRKTIRIGNAGGYWGDDPSALERQVFGGRLDYISIDFLAEITMSIMQKQKARDPSLGYAKDFIGMLERVLPKLLADKTTLITNAGGINPHACAQAILDLGKKLGVQPKVAVVYGDDILSSLPELQKQGISFQNMETGENFAPIAESIESANIYFGAAPVVEALKMQPDIIITGRVTDTGITLAPMIHEFDWSLEDWDRLAHGIVAGHILECGTQATGGNFTDWESVPSFDLVGFPIVEVSENGSFFVTKHPDTGGMVSVETVKEQLFYEMGDPKDYITPDVIADFSTINLRADGPDRVFVSGIKGMEPTALYKVSMAYTDGFKSVGSIMISGPNARAKAEAFANIFWKRCQGDFEETITEYVGWNSCHRSLVHADDGHEILLRLGVRGHDEKSIQIFSKLIPSLILSGPPGVAVIGGVPKSQRVVSYWPALMPKTAVYPQIALVTEAGVSESKQIEHTAIGSAELSGSPQESAEKAKQTIHEVLAEAGREDWFPLHTICHARSGDKGDTANIGVMARSPKAFDFLNQFLTAQKVKDYYQELCYGAVKKYQLPNMQGFNFLLEQSLGGGGTKTLRIDAQGKTFAQALLRQKAPIPQDILDEISQEKRSR